MSGLEVVGAIASTAQIACYVYEVSASLSVLCRKIQEAPGTVERHTCTIKNLIEIVELIGSNKWLQTRNVETLLEGIKGTAARVQHLLPSFDAKEITTATSAKRHWQAFRSLRRESQISAAFAVLEEKKTALTLCITTIQTQLAGDTSCDIASIVPKVESIHQEMFALRPAMDRSTIMVRFISPHYSSNELLAPYLEAD